MSFLIPEQLETDRLILRMFQLDDLSDIHEYYADYDCTKYTTQRQLEIHESWGKMAALAGHWSLYNYGSYALEEKNLRRVIGFAGLDYPIDWPEPEIQWALVRKFWGKGYASEAAWAVKKMADKYLPDLSLISLIHPENHNSINLAKSLGAIYEKDFNLRGDTCHIYRHIKF